MSKHVETFRSVLLFATVLLLIIALYRRLLFVMGKRKSMTATADVVVRLAMKGEKRHVEIQTKRAEHLTITMHSTENPTGETIFEGTSKIGSTSIVLPEATQSKTFCKVKCGTEEFNLYY